MSLGEDFMLRLLLFSSVNKGIPLTIITTSSSCSSMIAGNSYIKLDPASNLRDYGAYSNYGGVLKILFCPIIAIVI